jgi:hypothetical protein
MQLQFGRANKKGSTLVIPKLKMVFLVDAMWFKSRPSLSGIGLHLA